MALVLRISGLAGEICKLAAEPSWTVGQLKSSICTATGIPERGQQLLHGDKELRDSQELRCALPESGDADVTLLRRGEEQLEWIELVSRNFKALASAPFHITADRTVAIAAVGHHWRALRYVADELMTDAEVVLTAVEDSTEAMELAPKELRSQKDFMLAAVRRNAFALEYASDDLKGDREVVLAALEKDGDAAMFATSEASKALWADEDFALHAVGHSSDAVRYVSDALRAKASFMVKALDQTERSLDYAAAELWEDREFVLEALRSSKAIKHVPEKLKKDREVTFAILQHGKPVLPSSPTTATTQPLLASRLYTPAPGPPTTPVSPGMAVPAAGINFGGGGREVGAAAAAAALGQPPRADAVQPGGAWQQRPGTHPSMQQVPQHLSGPPRFGAPWGAPASLFTSADVMTLTFPEEAHAGDPREWLWKARQWLQRLRPRTKVLRTCRVPGLAQFWDPQTAVLYLLTRGRFDPASDIRDVRMENAAKVSVLYLASDTRAAYHKLAYNCFRIQKHEPREFVVVHSGKEPSQFFQETARQDQRVVYRFYAESQPAPGSPRLAAGTAGEPCVDVLGARDKEPTSVPLEWSKALKRNIACCIAHGPVMVHFDDGCLYAPGYVASMRAEVLRSSTWTNVTDGNPALPVAVVLSKWCTLGIADQSVRVVDLAQAEPLISQCGASAADDKWRHGFAFAYTKVAWEQQPFPLTTGTEEAGPGGAVAGADGQDVDFTKALTALKVPVNLSPCGGAPLVACGWYREALGGAAELRGADARALELLMFRGKEMDSLPTEFQLLRPALETLCEELEAQRGRYVKFLAGLHTHFYECDFCHFPVAKVKDLKHDGLKQEGLSFTAEVPQSATSRAQLASFDVCEFASAEGAKVEGPRLTQDNKWLRGWVRRAAVCRNCGSQLGWGCEPAEGLACFESEQTHSQDCEEGTHESAALRWFFIARHVRDNRGKAQAKSSARGKVRDQDRGLRCYRGHRLRHFVCMPAVGGPRPEFYVCDACDSPAELGQELWGCGSCDFDLCKPCTQRPRPSRK